jgi:tetratricopeptide (TPR) repeat protein
VTKFPSALAEVLRKCVQWDRDDRYGSFKEIRQELKGIYRELYGQESPMPSWSLVDLEADGLNNRGVSYFELGRREDALACWEQALETNQTHLEAVQPGAGFVAGGKIADDEVLRRLENCGNNPSADKQLVAEFKALSTPNGWILTRQGMC